MGDLSKTLDAIIRTPLWLFLALALAATVPLIPVPAVKAIGLTSAMRVMGLTVAVFALLFWSLFATSAAARSFSTVLNCLNGIVTKGAYINRYRKLSGEARWLLAGIEENGASQLAIPRSETSVRELRDAGLIEYIRPSNDDASIGIYEPTFSFQADIIYHRADLRKFLRENLPDVSGLRLRIEAANR